MYHNVSQQSLYSKIHHPNLIQFLGTETDATKSTVTILMNYIEGPNLHNLIFDTKYKKVSVPSTVMNNSCSIDVDK